MALEGTRARPGSVKHIISRNYAKIFSCSRFAHNRGDGHEVDTIAMFTPDETHSSRSYITKLDGTLATSIRSNING